jgi:hypothetical protein
MASSNNVRHAYQLSLTVAYDYDGLFWAFIQALEHYREAFKKKDHGFVWQYLKVVDQLTAESLGPANAKIWSSEQLTDMLLICLRPGIGVIKAPGSGQDFYNLYENDTQAGEINDLLTCGIVPFHPKTSQKGTDFANYVFTHFDKQFEKLYNENKDPIEAARKAGDQERIRRAVALLQEHGYTVTSPETV